MRTAAVLCVALAMTIVHVDGQQRRTPVRRAPAPKPTIAPAKVTCPETLGTGVRTQASYCFVLAGRDPAQGVLVDIPRHTGPVTLLFDIHNRHTYSEEAVRGGKGFARYSAVIGVLSMKGDLLGRAAVQSEFRAAQDLFERVGGGAGPGGAKAVAPIGREQIVMTIPANIDQVSLLGEILDATTAAGRETATPGRPVAVVSNIQVEYRPRR